MYAQGTDLQPLFGTKIKIDVDGFAVNDPVSLRIIIKKCNIYIYVYIYYIVFLYLLLYSYLNIYLLLYLYLFIEGH